MDKIKNILITIAIILLLLAAMFFCGYFVKSCEKKPQPSIIRDTTTTIDTLRYKDTVFYPKPVEVLKPIYDSIIDTVFVINDYFTGKIFEYGFKDTNITFKAGIMLHKNSIVSLIPEYEIYRKTTTITNNIEIIKPPKFALSVGADIGAILDSTKVKPLLFITASIQQNKSIYEAGYDPFNKAAKVGFKYTIIYK